MSTEVDDKKADLLRAYYDAREDYLMARAAIEPLTKIADERHAIMKRAGEEYARYLIAHHAESGQMISASGHFDTSDCYGDRFCRSGACVKCGAPWHDSDSGRTITHERDCPVVAFQAASVAGKAV